MQNKQKSPELVLGFSPCPNDIYLFFQFLKDPDFFPSLNLQVTDIHSLNKAVAQESIAFAKVSQYAACLYSQNYRILPVGNVFGFGYGPLLVSTRSPFGAAEQAEFEQDMHKTGVAIAGPETTGYLVIKKLFPTLANFKFMTFSEIPLMVQTKKVGYGIVINESRETLKNYHLYSHLDLGAAWQAKTGLPLPLGCLVAHRSLPQETVDSFIRATRASMDHAASHEAAVLELAMEYSQEKSLEVVKQHIKNYISLATYALTSETQQAIDLMRKQVIQC